MNASKANVVEEVKEITDGCGLDGVIEAAGAAETVSSSLSMVRPGGTIVVVGLSAPEAKINLHRLVGQEITLCGTYTFTSEYQEALDLVSSGRVKLESIISAQLPLEQGSEAFRRLENREAGLIKILLEP